MGTQLNDTSYIKLLEEDLEWLVNQPYSLERDHIKVVLECEICELRKGDNPDCRPDICPRITKPIDMKEQELKELVEHKLSDILKEAVELRRNFSTQEEDQITGEKVKCVNHTFTHECRKRHPWMEDIVIWLVPDKDEIAIMSGCDCVELPCMNEEERKWVRGGESVVSIEIESLTDEDFQYIVDTHEDMLIYDDPHLADKILKRAKRVADFAHIVPVEGVYHDTRLVILNVFLRNQLMGFVDVFVEDDEDHSIECHAVKSDFSDHFHPVMDKQISLDVESAIKFIVGIK